MNTNVFTGIGLLCGLWLPWIVKRKSMDIRDYWTLWFATMMFILGFVAGYMIR